MNLTSSPTSRVQVHKLSDNVVEIRCFGQITAEDAGYLSELESILRANPGTVSLLFNTLSMVDYNPRFPMTHIPFFKRYQGRIARVAVVHRITSVGIAVATVSLATNMVIRSFDEVQPALGWLKSS